MSKDMLGPVIRAAVGVPQKYAEVLAKIASGLNANAPNSQALYDRLVSDLEWVAVKQAFASSGLFEVRATPVLADGTVVTVLGLTRTVCSFVEIASTVLGLKKHGVEDSVSLGKQLIKRGYTLTWDQVSEMTYQNAQVGGNSLRADGENNYFFLETGDSANPVGVRGVYHGQEWYISKYDLSLNDGPSCLGCLMVRNLDLSL